MRIEKKKEARVLTHVMRSEEETAAEMCMNVRSGETRQGK